MTTTKTTTINIFRSPSFGRLTGGTTTLSSTYARTSSAIDDGLAAVQQNVGGTINTAGVRRDMYRQSCTFGRHFGSTRRAHLFLRGEDNEPRQTSPRAGHGTRRNIKIICVRYDVYQQTVILEYDIPRSENPSNCTIIRVYRTKLNYNYK